MHRELVLDIFHESTDVYEISSEDLRFMKLTERYINPRQSGWKSRGVLHTLNAEATFSGLPKMEMRNLLISIAPNIGNSRDPSRVSSRATWAKSNTNVKRPQLLSCHYTRLHSVSNHNVHTLILHPRHLKLNTRQL